MAKPTKPAELTKAVDEAIAIRNCFIDRSDNLLRWATSQVKSLDKLEEVYAGIAKVHHDRDGFIILDIDQMNSIS